MILFFVVLIFFLFAGYMYYANKKMIESGVHSKLNKKASKKKLKQNWSIDGWGIYFFLFMINCIQRIKFSNLIYLIV